LSLFPVADLLLWSTALTAVLELRMTSTARSRKPIDLRQEDDESLLLAYQLEQDREIFGELVRRYERELFVYLRRFLGDPGLAEDTFQATFLAVHLRRDQFEAGRRFRPWLYAIATNKAIDCQRQNKKFRIPSLDAPISDAHSGPATAEGSWLIDRGSAPLEVVESKEVSERLGEVLNELPEPMQRLIQLAFFQSLKYSEISTILGVPVGTVKSRVHTAMNLLSEAWHRKYPSDSHRLIRPRARQPE
jgi:RNA polymerase sigma-70 factor (ECF subfamily)